MELAFSAAGGGLGFALGALAAGVQHRLYRNPEHRDHPAAGRRLLAMRLLLGCSCAGLVSLALRPEHYDIGPALLTAFFGVLLLVIASTDFERRIIPNRLSYPGMLLAVALSWAWPDRSVIDIAAGAGFAVGVAGVLFALGTVFGGGGSGALGMGDAKLVILLGLLLGWPLVMTALFIGVIAAGIPAIGMLLMGRRRSYYSYGPYLVLGGVIALLWPGRFL
jgi:leader peptidase (prepilin peptidase)/N-methyltransferase